MTKQEFIEWAERHGYRMDKYGHMQKEFPGSINKETIIQRYKIQDISVRKEVQGTYSDGKHYWLHLSGNYLSKLSVDAKDLICGLQRGGC
jgi:hypothetical protein